MAFTGPIAPGDIESVRTPTASKASASTGRPAISPQTETSTPAGRALSTTKCSSRSSAGDKLS